MILSRHFARARLAAVGPINDRFVSPGAVTLPDARLGFRKGFLVRDPDGHVMEVTTP